jgi:hypothetical protein
MNSLGRHMQLIHNPEEKPWACEACPRTFSIKMYLTRHLRESPYCPASERYQALAPAAATAPASDSHIKTNEFLL